MLKQIGMGADMMECNGTSHGVNFEERGWISYAIISRVL